jgi:hypothetical protein
MLRSLAVLLLSAATAAAQVTTRPPGAIGGATFTGGTITAPILGPVGCTNPAYSFDGFASTGLCLDASSFVAVRVDNFGQAWTFRATAPVGLAGPTLADVLLASNAGYSWLVDDDTQMEWTGAPSNTIRWRVDNVIEATLSAAGFTATGAITAGLPFLAPDGSAAAPGFSFTTTPTAGMYLAGANTLGWSTSSTLRLSLSTTALTSTLPILGPDGLQATPTYGFSGAAGLGLWRSASNVVLSTTSINSAVLFAPGGIAVNSGFYYRGTSIGLELNVGAPYVGLSDVFMLRGALGVAQFSGAFGGGTLGYYIGGQVVEANATTKAPAITESGELYTNTGDADGSIINLPNDPTVGTQFRVALTVAQTVTINAATGETIALAGQTAGTVISSSTLYGTLHLVAVTGGSGAVWMALSHEGTWTVS